MTQTYEALGFDPAPGNVSSVQQLVNALSRVGNQLNDAHATLTRLGKSEGIWEGAAASGFSKKVGELPKHLERGHTSLIDAAQALTKWQTQLGEFQALAKRYEAEAQEARRELKAAQANPDLNLANQTFDDEAALADAQRRLDHAVKRVNNARHSLNAILAKARELLENHDETARQVAEQIRKAAEPAPDKPGLFERFMDSLKNLGEEIAEFLDDLGTWLKENADLIYRIGDWLGYASAACDVLAVIFSETVVGAAIFEGIGMVLNAGALAFHATGWALGSKKGSWVDIGLDIAGFVPFGDFARLGKVGLGAFKGVKIPMNLTDFGAKAADSWKRADDIIEAVGGTAKFDSDPAKWVMKTMGVVGRKADAIAITADTFKDRLAVSVARHFGDANLYRGAKLSVQKVVPELVERTPLGRIPQLADSVKPIVNDAGETVGKYVDPRSWGARGYEAVMGMKNLYKEGVRYLTTDVQYHSETINDKIDQTRDAVKQANPFG